MNELGIFESFKVRNNSLVLSKPTSRCISAPECGVSLKISMQQQAACICICLIHCRWRQYHALP